MDTFTHPLKILIADDKPENIYALQALLATMPELHVIPASSGEEALRLSLEHDFLAAIVDIQMPGMDGYELVELLRGNRSTARLPVIFVSAIYSDEYHHRKGYEVGAVDFLSKPFAPEILLSKVRVFKELYEQRIKLEKLNQNLETVVRERTAELEKAYQTLEKIDQNKTAFIHIAAHELRTPLTLIGGYADLLSVQVADEPQSVQMVKGILAGFERLMETVNNMIDISRLDNEGLELAAVPTQLNDIIKKVCKELSSGFTERRQTLHLEPGLERLPRVTADPVLLSKMFLHLIGNAIKYTPDGGAISIQGKGIPDATSGPYVEIQIQDTGIGIDPEYHQLIFEKFYQTGNVYRHSSGKTKFKGGGPGLGLPIARGIVEAHGGRIWAESSGYDESSCPGSIFHILLPICGLP